MVWSKRGFGMVAAAALVASAVGAEPAKKRPDPKLDAPRVWAAREVGATNWMWADCTLIAEASPRQARCVVTQATVRKRSADPTTTKMADSIAGALRWTKDATAACWAVDRTSLPTTPELRERALAFSNACKAKDWRTLANLLKTQSEEQAHTCDVTLAPPKEDVFTQRDENTWTRTVEGACGTIVYTIWRRKYVDQHWNFTQVKSLIANAEKDTACADMPPTPRTDWLDEDRPSVKLSCDVFK
ncbi:MAG TPA: hypothetical protein VMI54_24840 [Polyangiaceae bacterium]|nr:hypothetical protein [Polyangiaceae bacterium]